jgi:hypothetical protein
LFIITSSVMVTCIYKEDSSRVTIFCNRLDLSLLKYIIHELIVKIIGKRKSRTCEALRQILLDHSCTRRAPAPIALLHHATLDETRRTSECVYQRVCLSLSHLLHTLRVTHNLSRLYSTAIINMRCNFLFWSF